MVLTTNPRQLPQKSDQRSRNYDVEAASELSFEDPYVRRAFILKVYSILFVQLLFTFGVVCTFVYYEPAQRLAMHYPNLRYVFVVIYIALIIVIGCNESCRRKVPLNFVLLCIFTITMSLGASWVTVRIRPDIVLMAIGITCGLCFILTLFAMQTKIDFTLCGAGLVMAVLLLLVAAIFALIFSSKILLLAICYIGALIMALYFIYDTQLMLGGKHKYSVSPEEYIMGAMNLYVDIIIIFMLMLGIGSMSDD